MSTFFLVLALISGAAVVITLFSGLVSMARGAEDRRTSNKLMRWRVILQFATIILFALALLTAN